MRPLRSVIVTEIMTGSSGAASSRRDDRGLRVERVEDRLDEQQSTPPSIEAADLLGVGLAHLIEASRARNAGSLTSGESDSVRLAGPIAPATKRGRPGVAASRASRAPATFMLVTRVLEPVVRLRSSVAVNVLVS